MSNSNMRILHLCANDLHGGAARSSYRLHEAMVDAGLDSQMLVRYKQSRDDRVQVLKEKPSIRNAGSRINFAFKQMCLARARAKTGIRAIFTTGMTPWRHENLPRCDIVNAHWVSGFMAFDELMELAISGVNLFWTLHDINAFTGGCHFPADCKGYEGECGNCPLLGVKSANDISRKIMQRKQRLAARSDLKLLKFIAPSNWLAEAARASNLLRNCDIAVVPYGIDTELYRPGSKEAARAALDIPADAEVILVVAARLSDPRKGGDAFFEQMQKSSVLRGPKRMLFTVGSHAPELSPSIHHLPFGSVESEKILSMILGCADILLMPTLDDNLPNTALEAISSGLPVVTYNTGGMPDIVGADEAGAIVPKADVCALLDAADSILSDASRMSSLGIAARCRAERLFRKSLQVERYKMLYEEALSETTERRARQQVS